MTKPMSDAQRGFIRSLLASLHDDPVDAAAHLDAFCASKPDTRAASEKIDALLAACKAKHIAARAAKPEPLPMPEPGYYAVEYDGVLRFYRVKEGKGRYDGRRFLDRFRSDQLARIAFAERKAVCDTINSDPARAAMRFAAELTRCYCCGRMLTDETSRLLGIGPDCRGHGKSIGDNIAVLSDLTP